MRQRRVRRDRGSRQVTERDIELLGLIGEQYAVTLDQLASLIGRSYRTARGLRDRWCDAGWTSSARLAVDLPPFVWLTASGSSIARSPFRTWEPNAGLLAHIEAVTNVRIVLDRSLRLGEWECERALAKRIRSGSNQRQHLPDAVLTTPERTAIEVELTQKSRARVEQIITDLSCDYDRVWYFARPRFLGTLTQVAETAPFRNVSVRRYPPLAAEVARDRTFT